MCAITGLISADPSLLRKIGRMTDLLRHRGPDDEGFFFSGSIHSVCAAGQDTPLSARNWDIPYKPLIHISAAPMVTDAWLALGHRRLSILDLSPLGHQPMSYRDRYWIVFNGEIYNYLELRAELQAAGATFHSQTDTEVILSAYAHWGIDCLSRFNGMWALAIFDREQQSVFLARDRYGVKPLYYYRGQDFIAFASEIKAFTCLPSWRPQINGQAVHDYLLSSIQDHSAETMFDGVFQLEPGCCATFDGKQLLDRGATRGVPELKIQRWYTVKPRLFSGSSLEDAADEFQRLLIDSVRLRLRSDVPVGSCLSGGLDSSSIVCIANLLLPRKDGIAAQKTFSACSEIKRFDERQYIEKVVAATRVDPYYVFPTLDGLFQEIDRVLWHQDEPFGSLSIYAQWAVFGLAGQHQTKVMLDGQGADELLYGYSNFRRAFLAGLVRSGSGLDAWREARAHRKSLTGALSAFARSCADASVPIWSQRYFRKLRKNQRPPPWLCPDHLRASFPGRLAERFQNHSSARGLSLELISGAHLQMLLHWEDRNSMAHGVESRLPFLDYRMVEFALGLPDQFKIRHGWTKAVLRRGMQNVVPAEVLQRTDKMGFVTPEEQWARQEGAGRFREALAEGIAVSRGVLGKQAANYFEDMVSGRAPYNGAVWRMICFGRWLKRFDVATGS